MENWDERCQDIRYVGDLIEAVVRRCFSKQVFLKMLLYSLEKTCVGGDILTQVFSCEYFEIFKNSFFYRTPLVLLKEQYDPHEKAPNALTFI